MATIVEVETEPVACRDDSSFFCSTVVHCTLGLFVHGTNSRIILQVSFIIT